MHVPAGGMPAGQTLVDVAARTTTNVAPERSPPRRAEPEPHPGVDAATVIRQDAPSEPVEQAAAPVVGRALYGANARALVVDVQTRGLLLDVRA
jgi:hypothetical protein